MDGEVLVIGVLSLQGSFQEHASCLKRCGEDVRVLQVRTSKELDACDGLVIPGGESTAMARLAEREDFSDALRQFSAQKRPIWGTCAGLILLSNRAERTKEGGQALIGGLGVSVVRNFFGAQVDSFEVRLPAPDLLLEYGKEDTFRALFIRAPAISEVEDGVEVLVEYVLDDAQREKRPQPLERVVVAVRQGHLWATAFHPELTSDLRWHLAFVDSVRKNARSNVGCSRAIPCEASSYRNGIELPVYD